MSEKGQGSPSDLALGYTGAVAKYLNLASAMDTVMERQFAFYYPGMQMYHLSQCMR